MFGLFKPRPRRIGEYGIRVFQPDWDECSVEYRGDVLGKGDDVLLRGYYVAKTLFTVSDVEATATTLAHIARLCRQLDEGGPLDDRVVMGVDLVPDGRALVQRFSTFKVDVLRSDKVLFIETHISQGIAVGELLASVVAFNLSWLQRHRVTPGSLAAQAALQFFVGMLQYYDTDPLAFTSAQSVYQAPIRAYALANSNAVGLMGLADEAA